MSLDHINEIYKSWIIEKSPFSKEKTQKQTLGVSKNLLVYLNDIGMDNIKDVSISDFLSWFRTLNSGFYTKFDAIERIRTFIKFVNETHGASIDINSFILDAYVILEKECPINKTEFLNKANEGLNNNEMAQHFLISLNKVQRIKKVLRLSKPRPSLNSLNRDKLVIDTFNKHNLRTSIMEPEFPFKYLIDNKYKVEVTMARPIKDTSNFKFQLSKSTISSSFDTDKYVTFKSGEFFKVKKKYSEICDFVILFGIFEEGEVNVWIIPAVEIPKESQSINIGDNAKGVYSVYKEAWDLLK